VIQAALAVRMPKIVSLVVHTRRASPSSRPKPLGLAGLQLMKYAPETASTSDDDARYTVVFAPCSGCVRNGLAKRRKN